MLQGHNSQINKGALHTNHDALEFPDGKIVLLTRLFEGQNATVLTLPMQPDTAAEAEAQQRVSRRTQAPASGLSVGVQKTLQPSPVRSHRKR